MRILVLGAGAMGGHYGAELIAAGADVTFLVREKRQAQLKSSGLVMRSDGRDLVIPVKSVTAVGPSDAYDLVLLSCKAYDLDSAMAAIAPAMGPGAFVLPLLNGLSAYSQLDQRFGRHKVLGGVAYVAVSLDKQGVVTRSGEMDRLIIGARDALQTQAAESLHALLSRGGRARTLSASIEQELWNKWVMLAAGAAMTCLMRGAVKDILRSTGGKTLMQSAIAQCVSVARACGHEISEATMRQIESLLLNEASPWAASMMRDIAAGAIRLESDAIIGDMVRRGQEHGLDVSVLASALCHLQVYERTRDVAA